MSDRKQISMPLVLRSIPISKDLKRYYWKKYLRLRENNGAMFAADTFKVLRETLMAYVADENRVANYELYFKAAPVRKNGWLKKLFSYADVEPQRVFQFLRLYLVEEVPVISVDDAVEKQHSVLSNADPTDYIPEPLQFWCSFIATPNALVKKIVRVLQSSAEDRKYYYARKNLSECNSVRLKDQDFTVESDTILIVEQLLCEGVDAESLCKYHMKWRNIMTPTGLCDEDCRNEVLKYIPTRYSYNCTDYGATMPSEYFDPDTYDEDLMAFLANGYRYEDLYDLYGALPEEFWELADDVNDIDDEFFSVGEIQQIPKAGTVVYRSIAVPNRWLQAGTAPMRKFLRRIAKSMPRSCQFNQDKLDQEIYNHLMSDYAGCVDLSQSTDWLPYSWFQFVKQHFDEYWLTNKSRKGLDSSSTTSYDLLSQSFTLFERMVEDGWRNGEYIDVWRRGQPLGTFPSFEILTILNVLTIESICFCYGMLGSPYGVLGDDTVFFDKAVRAKYIDIMQCAGSPLSLHKSYEGRLVEFAGKLFVKNQPICYSPKPTLLTWTNLFDYQRAAKLEIKYKDLPMKVRKRFTSAIENYSGNINPEDLYKTMQIASDIPISQMSKDTAKLISNYYFSEAEDADKLDSDEEFRESTDVDSIHGRLIHTGTRITARTRESWFKQKYRPVSTDVLLERCLRKHPQASVRQELPSWMVTGPPPHVRFSSQLSVEAKADATLLTIHNPFSPLPVFPDNRDTEEGLAELFESL